MAVTSRQGVSDAAVIEQSWREPGIFAALYERHVYGVNGFDVDIGATGGELDHEPGQLTAGTSAGVEGGPVVEAGALLRPRVVE